MGTWNIAKCPQNDPLRDLQSTDTLTTPPVNKINPYNDQEDLVVSTDLKAGHPEMTHQKDNVTTMSENDRSTMPNTTQQGVEEPSWLDDTLLSNIVDNMVIPDCNNTNLHIQINEEEKA